MEQVADTSRALLALLLEITPLMLIAAVSPVVFITATTIATSMSPRAGRRFVLGCAAVLAAIGTVSAGILGASLTALIEREILSGVFQVTVGAVLVLYGIYLARQYGAEQARRRASVHTGSSAARSPATEAFEAVGEVRSRGTLVWGAATMATNYTTLPLYVAVTQDIGSAPVEVWWKIPMLLVVIGVVAAPAWLPLVLTRTAPELLARLQARFSSRAPRRWPLAPLLPIIACLAGGGWLLWIGFRG
ncbi:hypothetical protein [Brevibacterium ihuae]|uniref:hypothetical protein n=1 Tax=Brevibacterium ihuae TaxID=1631743 RepID=UPI000C76F5CB|nr:hypothetical protein [Brevibacterium ihuae]